jgi:sporadic carbohydrate cluster 2OG-Fe(II) oxygenase
MLKDFYNDFSNNSKKLIDDGFFIVDIEDLEKLKLIKNTFIEYLKEFHNITIAPDKLDCLHNQISIENVNEVRYGFYQYINRTFKKFTLEYLNLAKNYMFEVVGSELASNRMVNFSIQMPNDKSSILPIHSDIFSGESPYQINLWVPLTNAKNSNSMFIFSPKFSESVCQNFNKYEKEGLDKLLVQNKSDYIFLDVPYGKALIFSTACLHGNVLNQTKTTRLSFNCRYKNLFTPYNKSIYSDKKLGSFYKPITPKAASMIGLNFKIDD